MYLLEKARILRMPLSWPRIVNTTSKQRSISAIHLHAVINVLKKLLFWARIGYYSFASQNKRLWDNAYFDPIWQPFAHEAQNKRLSRRFVLVDFMLHFDSSFSFTSLTLPIWNRTFQVKMFAFRPIKFRFTTTDKTKSTLNNVQKEVHSNFNEK